MSDAIFDSVESKKCLTGVERGPGMVSLDYVNNEQALKVAMR